MQRLDKKPIDISDAVFQIEEYVNQINKKSFLDKSAYFDNIHLTRVNHFQDDLDRKSSLITSMLFFHRFSEYDKSVRFVENHSLIDFLRDFPFDFPIDEKNPSDKNNSLYLIWRMAVELFYAEKENKKINYVYKEYKSLILDVARFRFTFSFLNEYRNKIRTQVNQKIDLFKKPEKWNLCYVWRGGREGFQEYQIEDPSLADQQYDDGERCSFTSYGDSSSIYWTRSMTVDVGGVDNKLRYVYPYRERAMLFDKLLSVFDHFINSIEFVLTPEEFKSLQIAAKQGHPESQIYLGDCYADGKNDIAINRIKAVEWYKKARMENKLKQLGVKIISDFISELKKDSCDLLNIIKKNPLNLSTGVSVYNGSEFEEFNLITIVRKLAPTKEKLTQYIRTLLQHGIKPDEQVSTEDVATYCLGNGQNVETELENFSQYQRDVMAYQDKEDSFISDEEDAKEFLLALKRKLASSDWSDASCRTGFSFFKGPNSNIIKLRLAVANILCDIREGVVTWKTGKENLEKNFHKELLYVEKNGALILLSHATRSDKLAVKI